MRKGLAIIILVLMRFGLMGQEVDTIQVPNINITSTHSHQGDYIKPIESAATESVSKLLDSQSAFFLKSNGPGSSVTTSLLGGNASHTSLTLNGIPVTNPLIGQLDFSLLPIFFNQGMSLNTGLSPKITETGSIAGTVDINTYRGQKPSLTVGTTIKDYGSSESFISYHTYRKKASYSVNFSQLLAKNAFRYSIPELDEVRKQEHAENNSTNLYLTGKWILNKQHEISADYWFQDQSRNIPPTIVQTISTQSQDDKLHRVGVTQNYFKSHHSIRSRIGFTQQSIFFEDAQISYQNTGEFRTLYLESIAKFNQEQSLQYGIGYQGDINSADNGGFDTSQNLSTHKLLITTTYQKASSNQSPLSHLTLRFVYLNLTQRSNQAISGLLSHQLTLNASTQLKLSARRLWRAPAMNDLFWERGGNPNLLPEQGWEGNVGLFIRKGKALTFAGHLFTRWVENYILWAPEELGSPFMASNVSQVWARGIDLETNWKIVRDQYQVTINSKQSLIYSTPDRSNANIGLEKNKQLIYIPIGKSNLTANLQYRKSWVTVDLQHTRGYHGINDDLDPYTLVNVSLGKQLLIKSVRSNREHQFNIELRGVNLFDQAYSVIERRPMPGRYAELNFTYICPKLTP